MADRQTVVVIPVHTSGDIFMAEPSRRRRDEMEYPGGRVKEGETREEAALRLLNEQTGLEPDKLVAAPSLNMEWSSKSGSNELIFFVALVTSKNVVLMKKHVRCGWYAQPEDVLWPGAEKPESLFLEFSVAKEIWEKLRS